MPERNGAALVKELDAAGIERAVVLSVGYSFADERKALNDPDRLTREENDWTSAQVTKNAPRLIGFCSANPLRPAALEELERCLALPGMIGIKLHLGNAGITLRDPAHLARMQQLFALAQRRARRCWCTCARAAARITAPRTRRSSSTRSCRWRRTSRSSSHTSAAPAPDTRRSTTR